VTDRELLERAAKAAGYAVIGWDNMLPDTPIVAGDRYGCGATVKWVWMPLCDDGDALRLAVKLGIDVTYKAFGEDEVMVSASEDQFDGWFTEPYGDDKTAATRRAIVRAAAEMVKP